MGFRFRKSVKVGPMRVNISKSGVGYSVGGKGYRVTKKANGGMRTTASIPGTGISYVKDYSTKSKSKGPASIPTAAAANVSRSDTELDKYCPNCYRMLEDGSQYCTKCGHTIGSKIKKPIYKRWWFLLIVGVICLRACGAILGAEPTEQEMPTTESIIQTTETSAPTEAPTEAATTPTVSINIYGDSANSGEEKITYILNTDTRVFHKPSCHHAEKMKAGNRQERTDLRDSIINAGYKPCETCDP